MIKHRIQNIEKWREHLKERDCVLNFCYEAMRLHQDVLNPLSLYHMSRCGEYEQIGFDYVTKYQPCKSRLCPICGWFNKYKQVQRIKNKLVQLLSEGKKLLFLTLTIKAVSGDKLARAINTIIAGLKKLLAVNKVHQNLLGYVRNIEINYNSEADTFNPHVHLILVVKSTYYKGKVNHITEQEWRRLWSSKIKQEYQPQIKIKAVKQIDDITKVLLYNTKNDNVADYQGINKKLVQAFITLTAVKRYKHLFSCGGILSKRFTQ